VAIRKDRAEVFVGWRMLGTGPDDIAFNVYPNDASVGDLDGDGEYEIVLIRSFESTQRRSRPRTVSIP